MKIISLDSILLFIFAVIYLVEMRFENLTVFWVSILIVFLLLFFYLIIDIKYHFTRDDTFYIYKILIVISLIIFLLGSISLSAIILRNEARDDPQIYTPLLHDGVITTEEAIKFFLQGENPYSRDFFNTPLQKWNKGFISSLEGPIINPAFYHYIYLPFSFLFSAPFYLLTQALGGWYDQRFVYLLLFTATLFLLFKLPQNKSDKLLLLTLFSFNPFLTASLIPGLNDILVLFWVILTLYCLKEKKLKLSSLFLAFAVTTKHFAWFILPFYFAYIFFEQKKDAQDTKEQFLLTLKKTYPFFIVSLVILLPFLVWDFTSFIDDILKYPAGTLPTSYPITGYGFSVLVWLLGWVGSTRDYFPFWIFQALSGLPLLYFLLRWQKKNNTLAQMIFNYGLLLLVFLFFSRFFNFNYIGFGSFLFITAHFIQEKPS